MFYNAPHYGTNCTIQKLPANRVSRPERWSYVDKSLQFLELIVRFGKILNVNQPYDDMRFRDPLKYPIPTAGTTSLNDLTFFVNFFLKCHLPVTIM